MAVDGASLLAAAIRAACQAGALRRTVQAVASAVTAILVRPAAARSLKSLHMTSLHSKTLLLLRLEVENIAHEFVALENDALVEPGLQD